MKHKAVLLLGSNIGNKEQNITNAIHLLNHLGTIDKKSSCYITDAWGNTNQDEFYNLACILNTNLSPKELLEKILIIEKMMGRIRFEKWGPRLIDIDIIFYDKLIVYSDNLTIPHPQMHLRRFVLEPINEIANNLVHPVFNKNIGEILKNCTDTSKVKKLNQQ